MPYTLALQNPTEASCFTAAAAGVLLLLLQVPPFKKTLMDALPYVDFLFGNENEAATFAESENWGTSDIAEIALRVSCLGLQHLTHQLTMS
jgi:sugar/nucleoside kinase (ribokinase family)